MADGLELDVQVTGQESLVRLLIQAGPQGDEVLSQALYEEGQLAFRQSQKEVPVRWGNLKGSGRLHPPALMGGMVEVKITYGSTAVDYAVYVHEQQKKYNRGRKWKYLYDPVQARVSGLDRRLSKRVARILGGA